MASLTENFGLQKLGPTDPFSTNGQKYTEADRDTIDRLLYVGAEGHHHTGAAAASINPTSAGLLTQDTSAGTLAAGTTYYYQYTIVDANGFETAGSPVSSITTPAQITPPNPPGPVPTVGTGTLPAGIYFYAVSAYTTSTSFETLASIPASVTLTATGEVVLTMPTLPSGATGFNIYRLDPNASQYLYLASTTGTTYTDNGGTAVNCNRSIPSTNTTNEVNEVTFTLPAEPPIGTTWNLYRTTDNTNWVNSLLVAGTSYGTGFYIDQGNATGTGVPPVGSSLVASPSKILLTGGAEVQGVLPTSYLTTPVFVEFDYPGSLSVETGTGVWVCPFASATIVDVTCTLGRGSVPASTAVEADIYKGSGQNPSYSSIFSGASPNAYPQVAVGKQVGTPAIPNVNTLARGDSLTSSILQAGGGATPTDHDLTIVVRLWVEDS